MSKLEKSRYMCVNAECPEKDVAVLRLRREGKKLPCDYCDLELAEDIQAVTTTGPVPPGIVMKGGKVGETGKQLTTVELKNAIPPSKTVRFDVKEKRCEDEREKPNDEDESDKDISTSDFVKSLTTLDERPGPSVPRRIVDDYDFHIKEVDEITLFKEKLTADLIQQALDQYSDEEITSNTKQEESDDDVFEGEYDVKDDGRKVLKLKEHIDAATGRIAQYEVLNSAGSGSQGEVHRVKFHECDADKAEALNGVDDNLHRPKDGEIYAIKDWRNKAGQTASRKGKGKAITPAERSRQLYIQRIEIEARGAAYLKKEFKKHQEKEKKLKEDNNYLDDVRQRNAQKRFAGISKTDSADDLLCATPVKTVKGKTDDFTSEIKLRNNTEPLSGSRLANSTDVAGTSSTSFDAENDGVNSELNNSDHLTQTLEIVYSKYDNNDKCKMVDREGKGMKKNKSPNLLHCEKHEYFLRSKVKAVKKP